MVQRVLIGPLDKVGRTGPKAHVSIVANMQALTRARWSGGLLMPVQPICLCFRACARRRARYVGRCVVRPAGLRLRLSIGLEQQPLALSEDTMRVLLRFITMTLLIAAITVPVRAMGAGHDDMPGMGHMDKK